MVVGGSLFFQKTNRLDSVCLSWLGVLLNQARCVGMQIVDQNKCLLSPTDRQSLKHLHLTEHSHPHQETFGWSPGLGKPA